MSTTKIHYLDPVSSVLKGLKKQFEDHGIFEARDINEADIVVGSKLPPLRDSKLLAHQHRLLWTNEIRWSSETDKALRIDDIEIQIMNAFTDDVYVDPFHFLWVTNYKSVPEFSSEEYDQRLSNSARIAYCMASNHGSGKPFIVRGEDLDLYRYRRTVAIYGWEREFCDIYGAGWPEGMSKSVGRAGKTWADWEDEKMGIAKQYLYNICFENTSSNNYVTEKFWHCLMSRSIPIYATQKTSLHEYIPTECLIDCSHRPQPEEIYDIIKGIQKSEYLERVNSLIEKFNILSSDPSYLHSSRERLCSRFIDRVLEISNAT